MSLPVGSKAYESPSNASTGKAINHQFLRQHISKVVTRVTDEHSMLGRPHWSWLEHRHEEFRRPVVSVTDDEFNDIGRGDDSILELEVYNRMWGGIPFYYSSGDSQQLPPVAMKPSYCKSNPTRGGADRDGKIAFAKFLDPPDKSEAIFMIVIIDEVLRQDNVAYKEALLGMRNGNLRDLDVDFLLSRFLETLPNEQRQAFNEALQLVPTWSLAHQINIDYLKNNLSSPIAKCKAILNSSKTNGTNCCLSESNLPVRNLLCDGSVVMLLKNYVVEENLMNGSVGFVRATCFKNPEGDSNPDPTDYSIVEFPNSKLSRPLIPGMPRTYVPIPRATSRCEKSVVPFAHSLCKCAVCLQYTKFRE